MALNETAALNKDRNSGKGELQHRHFATIATILKNLGADAETVDRWADELAPTNPKFDRFRFVKAAS